MNRIPTALAGLVALSVVAGCDAGAEQPRPAAGGVIETVPPEPVATPSPLPSATPRPSRPAGRGDGDRRRARAGAGRVAVHRSGGLVGHDDVLTVTDAGSWRFTSDGRSRGRGALSDEREAQLDELVTGAALADESRKPIKYACQDGILYRVVSGGRTVSWRDCGPGSYPRAARTIAERLRAWTAL
ncbi:hypothetical protein GCM10010123_21150 [Pilimelia anulata]|uniref:Secreted protein n=1 Tax=Pilimelia anulata TaxID=53371 RepID=A0A8J3B7G3_9ACTN|nr:hypothetical protein [Pilimelia anulata]GGJ91059.1 hypothetical protein GCM10010123_21150 [Pilimelia anulata]